MKNELKSRTGGQLLVDALKVHGVDTAFCVPGESYLAVLDALYDARDAIKLIVCRQEGGAANMAEAYGKLTGRPGICIVTRGPGAANAAIGVHTAFQDFFDNSHANYAGDIGSGVNPKLAQRVKDADLLLVIGARLGEMTTSGYTLLSVPRPAQKLVHVHAGAEELGRVYQGDLLINSGMPQIAAALAAMPPVEAKAWREWTASARAAYLEWTQRRTMPVSYT